MIITRRRTLHIATGAYEFIDVSAEVTVDTEKDVPDYIGEEERSDWIDNLLTDLLDPEMAAADEVCKDRSFLLDYRTPASNTPEST